MKALLDAHALLWFLGGSDRHSTGAILVDRTHTSCGVQGMIFEMEAVPGDSLSAFYAGAGHLRLERE